MIQLVNAVNFQNELKYVTNNVIRIEEGATVKLLCRDFLIEGQISEWAFTRQQIDIMRNLCDVKAEFRLWPSSYKVISNEKERQRAGIPILLR